MPRTQITLTGRQYELLRRRSEKSGVSLAELVRRAVDETYGDRPQAERLESLERSFGGWSEESGEDRAGYLQELRRGLGARLGRYER